MKTHYFRKKKFQVSVLGLGYMGVSFAYSGTEESQAINTIHAAVGMGVTFLDSAEVYGPFDDEVFIGKAAEGIRDKIQIAIKFGFRILPIGQELERIAGADDRPEHIRESVGGPLERLNIGTIDLLYRHHVDPVVPVEDVAGTMADLVKKGKVRHIGLSEVSTQTLRQACKVHPTTAVQTEYSLWTRGLEAGILNACHELGVGFVPYNPLRRGFLTEEITDPGVFAEDDFHHNLPRFQAKTMRKNQLLLERLQQVATRYDATLTQIALAWIINKDEDIAPIPGAREIAHLRDNAGATNIALPPEDILIIEGIFTPGNVIGLRYNQGDFNLVGK